MMGGLVLRGLESLVLGGGAGKEFGWMQNMTLRFEGLGLHNVNPTTC